MKNLKAPQHLRKGQALFSFLTWLAQEKRAPSSLSATIKIDTHGFDCDGHFLIGDPFNIPDERLEALWDQWVASLPEPVEAKEKA